MSSYSISETQGVFSVCVELFTNAATSTPINAQLSVTDITASKHTAIYLFLIIFRGSALCARLQFLINSGSRVV